MLERTTVKIADGTHQQITGGLLSSMLAEWNAISSMNNQALLARHGQDVGRKLADVVPTLVYAEVSKAAWSLCAVSSIENANFDPAEFGKRCEAIAREQIERCRTAFEAEGTA
jgi:hypothetical protein